MKRDRLIRALVHEDTISRAAKAAGCARSTVYRYLQEAKFRADLDKARQAIAEGNLDALVEFRSSQCAAAAVALDALIQVAQDSSTPAGARVSAAAKLIEGVETAADWLEDWSRRRRDQLPSSADVLVRPATTWPEAASQKLMRDR